MITLKTKYGNIGIESTANGISRLILNAKPNKIQKGKKTDKNISKLLCLLNRYFQGKKVDFNVKLDTANFTDFYQKVWKEARKIPFGKTCTYSEIAVKIGRPNASRAVGQALGANPIAIVIPCHRVIRKDKSLAGFAYGLKWKKTLLELEKQSHRYSQIKEIKYRNL